MIVSWNWLQDYLSIDLSPEEVAQRLSMSGLNHEGTQRVGDDLAMDLEVTSNRGDCLGHIGVAREVAALCDHQLTIPDPQPMASGPPASEFIRVRIECAELCPRYTARVIRGVKIGPSPDWLQTRLATLGLATINNIVDITNYVMMECGQPLHAFDLARIRGQQIIVRGARREEEFEAIDHRVYKLDEQMCVIADATRALALGGVMGGADSEVSEQTTDLLIEAADFDPVAIRNTARILKLFSPSSHRFERGVDPAGIEWASRRCAEMVLEHAGGELAEGLVDVVGEARPPQAPITLRLSQIPRVLGIEIPTEEMQRILTALGNEEQQVTQEIIVVRPPSWRADLTREIDLVEEIGRIHGYDQIPEDVGVAMVPSQRTAHDRVIARIRCGMTANGFDEAMTASVVPDDWSSALSLWSDQPALRTTTPLLRGASLLRRSLIPSLLAARRTNESLQNADAELFEMAKIYLPDSSGLPEEPWMLGLVSERGLLEVKGVLRSVVAQLNADATIETEDAEIPWCNGHSCRLGIGGQVLGYLGELSAAGLKEFELRRPATFAELRIDVLESMAQLVPQYRPPSAFPAIRRDLNLIVAENVRWAELAGTVAGACGALLDGMEYRETFRDTEKDGAGKKRLIFSFHLRAADRTLTREEADDVSADVVSACAETHHAALLG
jgi:phenylalanyl-tRNA synthetase beta chain